MSIDIKEKEQVNKIIPDPRSSWPGYHFPEDSELWSKLLTIAHRRNPQLYGVLWVFRIEGTRIVKLRNGNFGLRPVIRPAGSDNPDEGWRDAADYKQCAKKFLAPWHDLLVEVLGELKEEGLSEPRQLKLEGFKPEHESEDEEHEGESEKMAVPAR